MTPTDPACFTFYLLLLGRPFPSLMCNCPFLTGSSALCSVHWDASQRKRRRRKKSLGVHVRLRAAEKTVHLRRVPPRTLNTPANLLKNRTGDAGNPNQQTAGTHTDVSLSLCFQRMFLAETQARFLSQEATWSVCSRSFISPPIHFHSFETTWACLNLIILKQANLRWKRSSRRLSAPCYDGYHALSELSF